MKDMVCPRCNNPLKVDKNRLLNVIEITCETCKYCSDVASNVRKAQEEFFSTVEFMDYIEKFRDWIKS